MGKSDQYFPNAELWDPHRRESMADPKDEEREKMDYGYGLVSTGADSTYLPFGAGRHRCIGEQFAYLQLSIVLIVMVREFKLRNKDGKAGVVATNYSVSGRFVHVMRFWLTFVQSLISRPMEPARVKWKRRNGCS